MNNNTARVVRYYTQAGPDYKFWSPQFNMHFGFYRWGMSPFDRESMLVQMNREVIDRLALDGRPSHILDMGCGLGATARWAADRFKNVSVSGLSIVPWQLSQAALLTAGHDAAARVRFVQGDFTAAPFPNESFDGIYSLESSCYAPGSDKAALLNEVYRLLKPGKRFVVADAFLKTSRRMSAPVRWCYDALCQCWSLETLGNLHQFLLHADALGFREVTVENISRNVTPSVLHIPPLTLRFAAGELLRRRMSLQREHWHHLMAGLLLMAFTIDRTRSGYFIISGLKPPR